MTVGTNKPRPTVDELFELLKRTNLPTVLVEGRNDIIFYRQVEDDLRDIGIDMLPAGNKDSVLELRRRLKDNHVSVPIAFIVDNDLWVHTGIPSLQDLEDIITTEGYSVENDLFADGELTNLLTTTEERDNFHADVERFCKWYALSVHRYLADNITPFRTHPGKVLDDRNFYESSITLKAGEEYPSELYSKIMAEFAKILRGKSLFAILHRQLSRPGREVKFSEKQLMAFGAAQRGDNFKRIETMVRKRMQALL